MFDKKFIEIVKKSTDKEFIEFDAAAQCNGSPIKCEDQFVAIIEVTQSKVDYLKNDFSKENRKQQKFYQDSELDTIVIVLESPHRHEFSKNDYIGPAIGTSGTNIEKFLLGNLAKYMLVNDLKENGAYFCANLRINLGKYCIFLLNSVQYQCSLGALNSDDDKKRRDNIFSKMFSEAAVKQDFIERLKKYSPKIIINCCTKGETNTSINLQALVQNEIDSNFPKALKLIGNHPSSAYFCHGFQDA